MYFRFGDKTVTKFNVCRVRSRYSRMAPSLRW